MEALGAAASVIATIQIAERIATACSSYIDGVQGYPKDLRMIYVEVNSLKAVFEGIEFLDPNDADDAAAIQALKAPSGPIEGSNQAMQELSGLIPSATPSHKTSDQKKKKIQSALDTLAWPFKAERVRKLLDELLRHKSTINMALTGQVLQDMRCIKKDFRKATQVLSGTGDWLFRSQPWKDWIDLRTRSVWLHGIPGAGKTILAAHATRAVMEYCTRTNNPKIICVYYYCYHGHNQDETLSLIRWLLVQLFWKADHVPKSASDIFNGNQEPDLSTLQSLMKDSLRHFERVFFIIDALDESQSFENLLAFLQDLITATKYRKVQLLTTSRQYPIIEEVMARISEPLSLSNRWVEEDIERYISVQIDGNRAFHRWPTDLRISVRNILSAKANGMFRWAVCQLDILRRLKSREEIDQALYCLPETLDETYERIFAMIHPADKQLVRHAITWTCFQNELWVRFADQFSCSLLLKTYEMCMEASGMTKSPIVNIDMLKEICGCLLVYNTNSCDKEFASLAHFTVREFLESDRLASVTSYFRIASNLAEGQYKGILTTIFRRAISTRQRPNNFNRNENLDSYCAAAALECLRQPALERLIPPALAYEFLSPASRLDLIWGRDTKKTFAPIDDFLSNWKWVNMENSTLLACFQLMTSGSLHLLGVCLKRFGSKKIWGTKVIFGVPGHYVMDSDTTTRNPPEFYGNLLELVAFNSGRNEVINVDCGFSKCLDSAVGYVDFSSVLMYLAPNHREACPWCMGDYGECFLRELLSHGAHTDPVGYPVTPLQIMCAFCDLLGVCVLLGEGADPDGVGDPDGVESNFSCMLYGLGHLHGLSPLQIVRHNLMPGISDEDRGEIEQLLVEHSRKRLQTTKY